MAAQDVDEQTYAIRLGALIGSLRLRSDLSPGELAAMVGTTLGTLSRWESGASTPRAYQLAQLATALEAPADALLSPPDPESELQRLLSESLEGSSPKRKRSGR